MRRMIVIGCCGAGKSTLSVQLGQALSLPVVHLDKLYWRENWQKPDDDTFIRLLTAELEKPAWVMDGNYNRSMALRAQYCDTIVLFDYPRAVCLLGVLRRYIQNRGKTRPDMGNGCPEQLNWAFLKYVWDFKRNNLGCAYDIANQAKAEGKEVVILKRRSDAKAFLARAAAYARQSREPSIS